MASTHTDAMIGGLGNDVFIGSDGDGSATDDIVVTVQPPVNNGVATGGGSGGVRNG